jgi:hypothetical protein
MNKRQSTLVTYGVITAVIMIAVVITYFKSTAANAADKTRAARIKAILPQNPSGLKAFSYSAYRIVLSWTDGSNNEDGFAIERSTDGKTFKEIATTTENVDTVSNTKGLSANKMFSYRVRAYNDRGYSKYTNVASTVTAPVHLPGNPTSLTATAVPSNQINLRWQDHSDNEFGFAIERSIDGKTFKELSTIGQNNVTFADVDSHINHATYYYRVRAFNGDGYSQYTNDAPTHP